MSHTLDAELADVKLIYRILHAGLTEHLELMDCELFERMQQLLQRQAKAEGIDVGDHAAWDAWLGNVDAASCEDRMKARRVLED